MGDHLRKVRLDRWLSQPEIAKLLEVTTDTVTGWELNRHEPTVQMAKRILEFLGYFPFYKDSQSIGEQLRLARMISGKTQAEVAKEIGVDESTLRWVELGTRKPFRKTREKIERFFEEAVRVLPVPG
ncbi:MAG: helix-turn-helix transcriptional regulator [Saprospiraceae bacterium]|nr:helix-turn-helix transcriptional regulator [Saprospiraceae bacterium]